MATEVLMPQMGESIAEGTVTRWLVAEGERVERDQPLLEISTDKVDAEIPSPATGVLQKILFGEGETVAVDTVIAFITAEGEEPAASEDEEEAAEQEVAQVAAAASAGSATGRAPEAEPEPGRVVSLEERLRTFSSPLVRRIAADEGVDLRRVEGTGIHGRVTKRDILAFLDERRAETPAARTAPAAAAGDTAAGARQAPEAPAARRGLAPVAPPAPPAGEPGAPLPEFSVPAYVEGERVEVEPMSRMRQITAAHMLYSRRTSAHVATVFEVDLSRLVALRQRAKDAFATQVGTKLTFMPFVFQAAVTALKAHPKFNASVDGTNVVYKKDVHLGMAVALDWGLIVPVIRNADQLSLVGLARSGNDLAERARAKKLKPEEVQGGTFTVTNPGVFGSLYGLPIINQPQVAILCVGAIQKRPVVVTDRHGNDALAIRSMAYLSLSYDHRLIDGADAERFMQTIKAAVEEGEWGELAAYV
jgi:2-oxoglutarate dehydrogenase E2 component (dihydrolipoamide succinyltransferase)